jgi:hypothetical protein
MFWANSLWCDWNLLVEGFGGDVLGQQFVGF